MPLRYIFNGPENMFIYSAKFISIHMYYRFLVKQSLNTLI